MANRGATAIANGLLELGSNYPEEIPYEDRQQVAYYESYDDSPEWWHVARYNEKTGTLEQDTVERNCLYAMDCWILAWMARLLGRTAGGGRTRCRAQEDGAQPSTACCGIRAAAVLLQPPLAGCRRRILLPADGAGHLHVAARKSGGPAACRVDAQDLPRSQEIRGRVDTAYDQPRRSRNIPKQDYWRGKVWGPVNWLVYQGLKIYDWDRRGAATGGVERQNVPEAVARKRRMP